MALFALRVFHKLELQWATDLNGGGTAHVGGKMCYEINANCILAPGEASACSVPAKPHLSDVLRVFGTQAEPLVWLSSRSQHRGGYFLLETSNRKDE